MPINSSKNYCANFVWIHVKFHKNDIPVADFRVSGSAQVCNIWFGGFCTSVLFWVFSFGTLTKLHDFEKGNCQHHQSK